MADSFLYVHAYFLIFLFDGNYHTWKARVLQIQGQGQMIWEGISISSLHCMFGLSDHTSSRYTVRFFNKFSSFSFPPVTQEAFSFCYSKEPTDCQNTHTLEVAERTSDSRGPWFLPGYQSFRVFVSLETYQPINALPFNAFTVQILSERLCSQRFVSSLRQKSVSQISEVELYRSFFFYGMLLRKASKARFHLN